MQVVLLDDHIDEFIGHDKGQDEPGDGDDDGGGQVADHAVHPGIPALRRHAHLGSDLTHTGVDVVKEACQVGDDTAHQDFLEPLFQRILDEVQSSFPSFLRPPHREEGA